MKSFTHLLPLFIFLPQAFLGMASIKVSAQETQPMTQPTTQPTTQPMNQPTTEPTNRKVQMRDCVQKLSLQPGQKEAIQGMQQQTNLTPDQKMTNLSQILTSQQNQQLQQCMQ